MHDPPSSSIGCPEARRERARSLDRLVVVVPWEGSQPARLSALPPSGLGGLGHRIVLLVVPAYATTIPWLIPVPLVPPHKYYEAQKS